jgi:hypothetical protein
LSPAIRGWIVGGTEVHRIGVAGIMRFRGYTHASFPPPKPFALSQSRLQRMSSLYHGSKPPVVGVGLRVVWVWGRVWLENSLRDSPGVLL